jgi:hypothetical protein
MTDKFSSSQRTTSTIPQDRQIEGEEVEGEEE